MSKVISLQKAGDNKIYRFTLNINVMLNDSHLLSRLYNRFALVICNGTGNDTVSKIPLTKKVLIFITLKRFYKVLRFRPFVMFIRGFMLDTFVAA